MEDTEKKKYPLLLEGEFLNFEDETVTYGFHFRKPTAPEIERAQASLLKNSYSAFRNLLGQIVEPEKKEELLRVIDEYPGIATVLGGRILERVGIKSLKN